MKTQYSAFYRVFALVLGLVGVGVVVPVQADDIHGSSGKNQVYSRDSVIFGRSYSEWSSAWQQWANSIPALEHPLFDNADCSKDQSGPVWFLGGKFCSTEDTACTSEPTVRSCTVPHGKALFFPITNVSCLDVEAKNGLCGNAGPFITQMRGFVGGVIDQVSDLQVTLDGKVIKGNLKKDFRVQSPVYPVLLPDGNLLQAIGETIIVSGSYLGVDDGIYIMLPPLPAGTHTLNFKGTFLPHFNFTIDFTYNLTVQ